ncbi:hypothetical protein QQ045_019709 [Rhodiola kirilowii]
MLDRSDLPITPLSISNRFDSSDGGFGELFRNIFIVMTDDEDNDAVLKKGDKVRKVDSMENVNISDPKSTNLHADQLTDSYPILTSCYANSKKKTVSNDLGIDPATVLSYPAVSTDANEELDEELNHEYVEASCTTDHFGEVNQYPNGVKDLLVAPNPSSDALEDIELNEDNCYGEFEDWRMYWDNAYQHYYYFNINTTESTWEPPPGMEHLLPDDMVISTENFIEVSNVGKNRKARKSRARKTSCGTNEGSPLYTLHFSFSYCPFFLI